MSTVVTLAKKDIKVLLLDEPYEGLAPVIVDEIEKTLEIIKTQDNVSTVSSVFLMCLADRVLVYGDCAVSSGTAASSRPSTAAATR